MSAAPAWANRITGSGTETPDQLLANPANYRVHRKAQQEALAGVLDQVGWVQNVLVNERTGHVVDGHLRVALAISRGEPSVPVLYGDLSAEEEALVFASLAPLAAMATTDEAYSASSSPGSASTPRRSRRCGPRSHRPNHAVTPCDGRSKSASSRHQAVDSHLG